MYLFLCQFCCCLLKSSLQFGHFWTMKAKVNWGIEWHGYIHCSYDAKGSMSLVMVDFAIYVYRNIQLPTALLLRFTWRLCKYAYQPCIYGILVYFIFDIHIRTLCLQQEENIGEQMSIDKKGFFFVLCFAFKLWLNNEFQYWLCGRKLWIPMKRKQFLLSIDGIATTEWKIKWIL